MNHLTAIYNRMLLKGNAGGPTRKELRRMFWLGTGKQVPESASLRRYVAEWHTAQMAINAGGQPSAFWRKATE